jgi:peptidyl-prolyl cis-trans isomerase SurA
MNRYAAFTLCSALVASTATAQSPTGTAQSTTAVPLDGVIAVVGDQVITRYDLKERINQLIQGGMPAPTTDSARCAVGRQTVQEMVEQELLLQKAKELKIEAPDNEITGAVDKQIRETRIKFPNESEFRSALVSAGLGSPEEYRTYLLEQFRRNALLERTMAKLRQDSKLVPVNVTNAEVQAEFARAKPFLGPRPAAVTFRQVVIAPHAGAVAKEVARAKAESLLAELKRGSDFERVAKRESMETQSKEIGGDMGWIRRGDRPEFERWLFGPLALRPGQLSPVFETPFGYHILRIDRVQTGQVRASQIMLAPKIDSTDIQRAAVLADSVAAMWKAGVPFDTLAKKYHDYAAKEETSLLTPFVRDSLPPSYQAGFAGKKANDISVFRIPGASDIPKFVVAQLVSVDEGGERTLTEMRETVRNNLAERGAVRRYLDALKRQTYVSIHLDKVDGCSPTKP